MMHNPRWLFVSTLCLAALGAVQISGPMPAKPGEICAVCYGRTIQGDVAFIVDGQRFPVMKECQAEFLHAPQRYISAYRPEGALFRSGPTEMRGSYLALGALALLATLAAALLAHQRLKLAYPGLHGWLSKIPDTLAPAPCPGCGASNHPSARSCPGCGAELAPTVESEVIRARI